MLTQLQKAEKFQALHRRTGAFVIPNPWDVGSARMLAGLGYEALATTSAGFANAIGRVDGGVTREQVIQHCRELSAATDLPVSADLENCFAEDPREAARTIALAAEAGVVGGSIEDFGGVANPRIYEFSLAVERVHAAVEVARSLKFPFTLTARAENLLRDVNDLDDTIRRLQAFEKAGADVLYAPGLTTLEQIRKVSSAVGKPINVLGVMVAGATVAKLQEAGAKRISVGSALAQAAVSSFIRASEQLREGKFDWTADMVPGSKVEGLLR